MPDLALFRNWIEVVALLATMAIAFGMVKRLVGNLAQARLLLGAVFGLFAAYEMFDPLAVAPGIIVDMRAIPVAAAAGFLGLEGTLACLAVALGARGMIGGAGVWAGMVGILAVGIAGRIWAGPLRHRHAPRSGATGRAWPVCIGRHPAIAVSARRDRLADCCPHRTLFRAVAPGRHGYRRPGDRP